MSERKNRGLSEEIRVPVPTPLFDILMALAILDQIRGRQIKDEARERSDLFQSIVQAINEA